MRQSQAKPTRKILKPTLKDTFADLRSHIKKPLMPASFTYTGMNRAASREPMAVPNRGTFAHGESQKSSLVKTSVDFKLSVSDLCGATSGAGGLDLKTSTSKSPGVASLSLASNTNGQAASNWTKKQETSSQSHLQRTLGAKPSHTTIPATKSLSVQNSSMSKTQQASEASVNIRGPASMLKKGQAQDKNVMPKPPVGGPTGRPGSRDIGASIVSEKMKLEGPGEATERTTKRHPGRPRKSFPAPREGTKSTKTLSEMSTGEEGTSSESEQESTNEGQELAMDGQAECKDWRPTRSLIEHVFVTDVTANLVTVTVKESPTSVGFFSIRNY